MWFKYKYAEKRSLKSGLVIDHCEFNPYKGPPAVPVQMTDDAPRRSSLLDPHGVMEAELMIVRRTPDPPIEVCAPDPPPPQEPPIEVPPPQEPPIEVHTLVHRTTEPFAPVIPQTPSSEACSIQSQTHYSVAPVHMDPRMYKSGFVPTNLSSVGRLCSNRSVINSSFITVYNTGPAEPKAPVDEDKTTWCCCLS